LGSALAELIFADRTVAVASGPPVLAGDGEKSTVRPAYRLFGTTRDEKELERVLVSISEAVSSRELQKLMADKEVSFEFKKRRAKLPAAPQATVFEWKLPTSLPGALDRTGALGGADTKELESFLAGGEGLMVLTKFEDSTWLVVGESEAELREGLTALEAQDAKRLGADPKLAPLLETPAVGAAFFRLGWLFGLASQTMSEKEAKKMKAALSDLPHQGRVPVTYFLQATAAGRVESTVTIRVPPEFLTDAFGLALIAGASL
jgi:hypothetical protein